MLLVALMNTLYSTERNRKTCECYAGIWNVVDVPSSRYYYLLYWYHCYTTYKISCMSQLVTKFFNVNSGIPFEKPVNVP